MSQLRNLVLPILLAVMPMQTFAQDIPAPVNMAPIIAYLLSDSSTPPPAGDTIPPNFTSSNTADVNENETTIINITTDDSSATLTLGGTDADKFNLDGSILSFKVAPNYEVDAKTYSVTITAKDSSNNSNTQTITISVLDINEHSPIFNNLDSSFTIAENSPFSIDLNATDADGTSSINYSLNGTDKDFFNLVGNTVSFNTNPDYEEQANYSLIAEASDGTNTTTKAFTVNLNNVAETAPTLAGVGTIMFDEDTAIGTVISSGDLLSDSGDTEITSFTLAGDDHEHFAVSLDGTLSVNHDLDYDLRSLYELTAIAANTIGNSNQVSININLTEASGVATLGTFNEHISEHITQSTSIGSINVIDDGGSEITYYELFGTDNDKFLINSNGAVSTAAGSSFNFEDKALYELSMYATNSSGNSQVVDFTVTITDANDNPAVSASITHEINEEEPFSFNIGASDEDGDSLTYTFSYGGDTLDGITLGSSTGIVSIDTPIKTYEERSSYTFGVYVSDGGGNNVETEITLQVININTPLYANHVTYNTNQTSDLSDDELYIYFNKAIDTDSLNSDKSVDFDITGTGAIGTSPTVEFNSDLSRITFKAFDSGDGAIKFVTGADTIAISEASSIEANDLLHSNPDNESAPIVEKIIPILKTGGTEDSDGANRSYILFPKRKTAPAGETMLRDVVTNLIWQDYSTTASMTDIGTYCSDITYGGYSDWRTPTLKELRTIVDYGKAENTPKISSQFNFTNTDHWFAIHGANTTTISFSTAHTTSGFDPKYMRCVRN